MLIRRGAPESASALNASQPAAGGGAMKRRGSSFTEKYGSAAAVRAIKPLMGRTKQDSCGKDMRRMFGLLKPCLVKKAAVTG